MSLWREFLKTETTSFESYEGNKPSETQIGSSLDNQPVTAGIRDQGEETMKTEKFFDLNNVLPLNRVRSLKPQRFFQVELEAFTPLSSSSPSSFVSSW